MDEINIKTGESKVNAEESNIKQEEKGRFTIRRIIYYSFGVLEVLFAFRLVFKVLGANSQGAFVSIIYSITQIFLAPFTGIFRMATTDGIETKSVLEPTLIIAMVVYTLLAWGIVKLIEIMSNRKDSNTPSE